MSSELPSRRLDDPSALRAIAHPVRVALLDLLSVNRSLTATEAAEQLGESPANCSFHLRTLAKYGFVEEAPGGRGRERPWRAVRETTDIPQEEELTPEARVAADAFSEALEERARKWRRNWKATRSSYPKEWRGLAFDSHATLLLTSDQTKELGERIQAIVLEYAATSDWDTKLPGAIPVGFEAAVYPLRPPATED